MRANDDGRTVAAMDVLTLGIGETSAAANVRSGSKYGTAIWPSAASTGSTAPPASPTFATQSPSHAPPETRGIDPRYFSRELVNGRR
jgi:hypothetical protein